MGTLLPKTQKTQNLPYKEMRQLSNNWQNGPQGYIKDGNYYDQTGTQISKKLFDYSYNPDGTPKINDIESTNVTVEPTINLQNKNGKSNVQFRQDGTTFNNLTNESKRNYRTIIDNGNVLTYDIDNPWFNNFQSEGTGRTLSEEELQNFLNEYNTKKSGGTLNRTKLIPKGQNGMKQEAQKNPIQVKRVQLKDVKAVDLGNIYLEDLDTTVPIKEAFEKYPETLVYMDINTGKPAKNSDMEKYGYKVIEDSEDSLNKFYDYLKIPKNVLDHLVQSYKNRFKTVSENLKNGEIGKALYSNLGYHVDEMTTPFTSVLMKYIPSYITPIKDSIITAVNRAGRSIFDDPEYTAVLGQTYTNDDLPYDVTQVAKEHLDYSINNPKGDQFQHLTEMVQQDVNEDLNYGNSKLLYYPFNPTAAYAWTIGRVSPYYNDSEMWINDVYDNSPNKNNYYKNRLNGDFSDRYIGDFLRALGGKTTSHDDEPNEGKQKFNLKFNR